MMLVGLDKLTVAIETECNQLYGFELLRNCSTGAWIKGHEKYLLTVGKQAWIKPLSIFDSCVSHGYYLHTKRGPFWVTTIINKNLMRTIHIRNYDNGTHVREDLGVHVSHKLHSSEEAVQGSWMKTSASHRSSLDSCLCLVQFTSSAFSLVSLLQVFTTPIPHSYNCQSNLSKTQIKQSCFSASSFSVITAWFSNFHGYRDLLEKLLYTYT